MYRKLILLSLFLFICLSFSCDKKLYSEELLNSKPTTKLFHIKDETNKLKIEFDDYYLKYNGYIDQVAMFDNKYDNQDYDGDGLTDRIYRKVFDLYKDGEYMGMRTNYRVDFGNGDKLEIGDFNDIYTGIQLNGYDLTGDGVNEIVFCGNHKVITSPSSGSEIAVYQKNQNRYDMMSLPRLDDWTEIDKFEVGHSFYKLNMKDDKLTIYSPATNYKETITLTDKNVIDSFKNVGGDDPITSPAWIVKIVEYKGVPTLVLYNHIGDKYSDKDVITYLVWQDNECRTIKMELVNSK